MADSAVDITAGTGTSIDTRTESTNGHHRQVVVIGDPTTNAGVAAVNASLGLQVNIGPNSNVGVIGGSLTVFQSSTPWLVTMATLPVIASGSIANAGGSLSAFQGGSWLVSVATLPVIANINNSSIAVTQSGTWDEVGINDSGNSITIDGNVGVIGGSLSAWAAGGSLSAFQGGSWNVGINAGTNNIGDVDILSIAAGDNNIGNVDAIQSGTWTVQPGNTPNTTAWLVTMATLPVVGNFSLSGAVANAGGSVSAWAAGGSLSAFQGGTWTVQPGNTPNTVAWLVTMATLPVVTSVNVAGQATVTALQGDAGSSAWRVTMATLPVVANINNTSIAVTQSGTWDEVGINDSGNSITIDGNVGVIGGSLSAWVAGGSLSAFQGGSWNVGINAGTNNIGDVDILSIAAGDNNIGNVDVVTMPTTNVAQSGTWTVQPGNTPNTTAWLVTMATMSVVGSFAGQATVTALQGDAGNSSWRVTMATLPVMANIVNTTLAVTQSGTWDEVGINDSGNSITIDGNVGVIGGSLSAYIFGGSLSAFNAGGSLSAVNIGGSLSAFQGGTWNVFSSLASGTSFIGAGQYKPTLASLNSMDFATLKTDLFSNLMVNVNVPLPNSTKLNRFYTYASMASLMAAPGSGKRLVVREFDFSGNATVSIKLVEDHAGTPATVWGPHYFLPYAGVVKPQTYIPLTANKSLGVDIAGSSFNSGLDIRVETENS